MKKSREDTGFTLVELMIVVAIIGILVTIAIPVMQNSQDNARRKSCYANERVVEGAYASRVASDPAVASTITDWNSLMSVVVPTDIKAVPACPSGGIYTFSNTDVTCSAHGGFH